MKVFDYIIVGAGTAGCVLANRLSEDPNISVLVLEAGGWDRDPLIHIPLGFGRLVQKRLHDWGYSSEPEPSLNNRVLHCPRGKVIGGSSSINAMMYARGHAEDYNRWAAEGLPTWSFQHVIPYFKKSESWELGERELRGKDGPLTTGFSKFVDPLADAFLDAGKSAGFPSTSDYNADDPEGFGVSQLTIRKGKRCSAATAYLRPALKRKNLKVQVHVTVSKVLFEDTRAVGVEYIHQGQVFSVRANHEVILCGGAFNSPQLLMLSGIGEPEILRQHGITVKVPLQGVGKNLQDHIAVNLTWKRKIPGPFLSAMRFDRIALEMLKAYFLGKGFAATVPGGVLAFIKARPTDPLPNIQLILVAGSLDVSPYLRPFKPPFQDTFSFRSVLLRPISTGYVGIKSSNPHDAPKIVQNFLASADDMQTMRDVLHVSRNLVTQPSLRPFVGHEMAPGSAITTENQVDTYMKNSLFSLRHPACTCKMGSANDPMAVVDPEFRVVGTQNLRVVDASAMPRLVAGNINAVVFMMAERAADAIRQSR